MESTDINMADYNKDEMDREESKPQYDPRMRYMETVHPPEDEFNNPKHYTEGFGIEPIEYIIANEMDFLEGNIIKYVSRYPLKGGVRDLKKAQVYIEMLIKREEKKQ
jgi:hypothetical protein